MERIVYWAYGCIGTVGYCLLRPFLSLLLPLGGRYFSALDQRLGIYTRELGGKRTDTLRIWIHASSVGEVQAASLLITALTKSYADLEYVLTSSTAAGRSHAQKILSEEILCLMAPLDVPIVVRKALHTLAPDVYICLETELWPAILREARVRGVIIGMVNGRLSARSYRSYARGRFFFTHLIKGFSHIAVISQDDRERFVRLGAREDRVYVCGNIKHAARGGELPLGLREKHRQYLQAGRARVLVCGSTHAHEEEQLLRMFGALRQQADFLFVLAPRHLNRLEEVEKSMQRLGLHWQRYTALTAECRTCAIILLDTMGDLAEVYSGADFIFCGGSLVKRGGHNIMEALRWQRPVYYGPSMEDFQEAAALAEAAGCGFQVADSVELLHVIGKHLHDSKLYREICMRAKRLMSTKTPVVDRQVEVVGHLIREASSSFDGFSAPS
ncbi:MAG: hypothetical protein CSA33_02120 [Desulfobulbus propionicus]|nr:MAG: hypothetical protein CSA33_02120 [Desulfobulbus propionicus]